MTSTPAVKRVVLLVISIAFSCNGTNTGDTSKCCSGDIIETMNEVDSRMLVAKDSSLFFSKNDSIFYALYKFKHQKVTVVEPGQTNVTRPFLVAGTISGLMDASRNEHFVPTSSTLTKYTGGHPIQQIYTFKDGTFLLYQLKGGLIFYLVDLVRKSKRELFEITSNFNGCDYDEETDILVVSYDEELAYTNLSTGDFVNLPNIGLGKKLNPSIHQKVILFASNAESEFFRIYRVALERPPLRADLLYSTDHDLRLPKSTDRLVYFIEIVNSEYLLKSLDLSTRRVKSIIEKGVVYDFDFITTDKLAVIYSDMFQSRSVIIYDVLTDSLENITSQNINHNVSIEHIKIEQSLSSGYLLKPPDSVATKGVILFFHPGVHGDFSPRWDTVLINLCNQGYIIVAPNYPTSSGYGKSFYEASVEDAVADLQKWKSYILSIYNLPLHCFSVSAGSYLMEEFLIQDHQGVSTAVSLFGVYLKKAVPKLPIPSLYILGERDPIVNFAERRGELLNASNGHLISVHSYADEGHLFTKSKNRKDAICRIASHLSQTNTLIYRNN